MIRELGLKNKNLFINSDMAVSQRHGLAGAQGDSTSLYTTDRFKMIAERTDILGLEAGASFIHDTTIKPAKSIASLKMGRSTLGPNVNFLRIEQRVEASSLIRLDQNRMVFQALLKRDTTATQLDTKVVFGIKIPTTTDTHTDLLDTTAFDLLLEPIKEGGSSIGSLTLGNISSTVFERYFAVFDIPTGVERGLSASIQLVRPAGSPIENLFVLNVGNTMLSPGGNLSVYEPAGLDLPGMELGLMRRYYEKTFPIDVLPVAGLTTIDGALHSIAPTTNGSVQVSWDYKSSKRIVPTIQTFSLFTVVTGGFTPNPLVPIVSGIVAGRDDLNIFSTPANTAINNAYAIHVTAEAEL